VSAVQIGQMLGDPRCTLANLHVIFKAILGPYFS
jgi:hypothetical protein